MSVQGRYLSQEAVERIAGLLLKTDMTINEIADRMSCSKGTVGSINRRFRIRDYGGRRSTWEMRSNVLVSSSGSPVVPDDTPDKHAA
jgi:hypothetical protein